MLSIITGRPMCSICFTLFILLQGKGQIHEMFVAAPWPSLNQKDFEETRNIFCLQHLDFYSNFCVAAEHDDDVLQPSIHQRNGSCLTLVYKTAAHDLNNQMVKKNLYIKSKSVIGTLLRCSQPVVRPETDHVQLSSGRHSY